MGNKSLGNVFRYIFKSIEEVWNQKLNFKILVKTH